MCDRYVCKLSPELLKKAVTELNEPEDNEIRLAAIDKLKNRFQEEAEGLELVRTDDAFLLRFLRVRKFDHDRAYQTLVNYHQQRKDWRDIFDLVDDPKLAENLLRSGAYCTLREGQAKDGTFVVIGRAGLGFDDDTTMQHFVAVLILTVEKVLEQEEAQIYGFTFIEDMAQFGVSIALQFATNGRRFHHLMQECVPARIKSLNMINEALVFDIIHAVMSQFMKEKIKKRLTLHGSEVKTLHEKVDPKYLPFFLGGSGPDLNPDWWTAEILSSAGEGEDTAL